MTPPRPRVWIGLAFLFAFVGAFVIGRLAPGVVAMLSGELPERAAIPILVLLLMLVGVALQAVWWTVHRLKSRPTTGA